MAQISHSSFNRDDENSLIEQNMGLVNSVVETFNPSSPIDYDEFQQAGRIGLMKAARKYDKTKGQFSTIAWHNIKWEILSHIKENQSCELSLQHEPPSGTVESVSEYFPSTLTDQELEVLNLRKDGHTFQNIGDILGGYSKSWANLLFHSGINKIREANHICLT